MLCCRHLPHLHVQPCTQERNTLPCQADNIDRHLQEVPVVKPHEHEINVFHIHVRSFLQAVLCFRSPLNNNFDVSKCILSNQIIYITTSQF